MKSDEENYRQVCATILSLLLARKGSIAVGTLDQDYYDIEGKPIPWRKFGYSNLVEFLQNTKQHFEVYSENGTHYVTGKPSEKTKHIKHLVDQQKTNNSKSHRSFQYTSVYNRQVFQKRSSVRVPVHQLLNLIQYINNYPRGVHIQTAVEFVKKLMPNITLLPTDLREQLKELSHQVHLNGNIIYPAWTSNASQKARTDQQHRWTNPRSKSLRVRDFASSSSSSTSADSVRNHYPRHSVPRERRRDPWQRRSPTSSKSANTKSNHSDDQVHTVINDRTKSRLWQLMQKYPDGLTCNELPDKFLDEYRVHLNYAHLGFSSVRQFASCLPQIFYMKPLDKAGNFLLFSADKRPIIHDRESSNTDQDKSRPGPRSDVERNNATKQSTSVPRDVASRVLDVLKYNESTEQISVASLEKFGKHREVYIAEVFSPTFFWIHLREYNKYLVQLMDSINDFYNCNRAEYAIPKTELKMDLNCVCMYEDRWHRGIIKTVDADFKVKILFFDYGTVKTYPSHAIYYLHRRFSYLPMQAICCGLSGVRPYDGDFWKKSVTVKFCDQVLGYLLDATIVSIDALHNYMTVELTNISGKVNEWLVEEEVARYAEPIESCEFLSYYGKCDICDKIAVKLSKSAETSDMESVVGLFDAESTVTKLSDVESESVAKKPARASRNVSSSSERLLRMLRNYNSHSRTGESHIMTRSRSEKLEKPTRPVTLLERLKALDVTCSSSSTSSVSEMKKELARQIDEDKSTRTGPGHGNGKDSCRNEKFELRNSDDEEFDTRNDFGMFQSMYGGHGLMRPCDWSKVNENVSSRKEIEGDRPLKDLYNIMKRRSNNK